MDKLFPKDFMTHLNQQSILLVGVGGIGCELLKSLVKFNFKSYTLLDLDTIEISNLNRQFIFRKEHKGLYKSEVAKNEILASYPNKKITSSTDSILTKGVSFFSQYSVVFLALDNIDARSHVNKYCMALTIPILEAGTSGFLGQGMLMHRDLSRCYDCWPRDRAQKTYPVCTIRTLPEKPVHCMIWAKYLFGVLFSVQDDANLLDDQRDTFAELDLNKDLLSQLKKLFDTLFNTSIREQSNIDQHKFVNLRFLTLDSFEIKKLPSTVEFKTKMHDISIYKSMFLQTALELYESKKRLGVLTFEKDDENQMRFITACSNIRSYNYGIEMQNEFEVKKVAGNIVNAICSTNSLAASIQGISYQSFLLIQLVNEYIKFLQKQFEKTPNNILTNKEVFIKTTATKLMAINLMPANPNCLICQKNSIPCIIYLNLSHKTLDNFLSIVQQKETLKNFIVLKENQMLFEQGKLIIQDEYMDEDEVQSANLMKKKQLNIYAENGELTLTMLIDLPNGDQQIQKYILVHTSDNDLKIINPYGSTERVMLQQKQKEESEKQDGEQIEILDDELVMLDNLQTEINTPGEQKVVKKVKL